jgi:hypothetical protein
MANDTDRLVYLKTLKDGRVVALNVWKTGAQELVYPDKRAFEQARHKVETEGAIPVVTGYVTI